MQTQSSHAVNSREVNDLLAHLHFLLQTHRQELGDQRLDHELEWLEQWIEHYMRDSNNGETPRFMDDDALSMLRSIHKSLAEATAEEQRMQAESPLSDPRAEHHMEVLDDARDEIDALLHSMDKTVLTHKRMP